MPQYATPYTMGNYLDDKSAAVDTRQRQQANAMKLDQMRQSQADDAALRGMNINDLDPDALLKAGKPDEALKAYQMRIDNAVKGLQIAGQVLSGVNDQASYDGALAFISTNVPGADKLVSQVPKQFDPNAVKQFIQYAQQAVSTKPNLANIQLIETTDGWKAVDKSQVKHGEVLGAKPSKSDMRLTETEEGIRAVDMSTVKHGEIVGKKPKNQTDSSAFANLDYRKSRDKAEDARRVQDRDAEIVAARRLIEGMSEQERKGARVMNSGFIRAEAMAKESLSTERGGKSPSSSGASFKTEAEANAAIRAGKVKSGQLITINGRKARVP